jgi:hypothetical protein
MRAGHLWLASLLVFPLVGAPLLKARAFRVFGLPTRAVLSAGVGAVLLSWTMTLFALLRLRWGPVLVLVAAAVAFALSMLLPRDEEVLSSPDGKGDGRNRVDRAAAVIAISLTTLSLLAAFFATLAGRSTSPDLLLFWGPKAQEFADARTIDVEFLSAPYMEYLHVYYPPLVTNVFAFPAMIAGRLPWGAAAQTFPLLLAATAIGLAGILKTESSTSRAAATAALATSAMGLLGIHAAVAGNADPFLLFFEILGLALLLTAVAASTAGKLLTGLLLAGAASSKVEGLPFLLAAVVIFLVLEKKRRGPIGKAVFLLVGPTAVSLGTWFAFGAVRKLFYGYQSYGRFLDMRWDHFDEVARGFGAAFWKAGYALPFIVPLVVLLATRGKTRQALLPVGVALALIGFFWFTYLHGEPDPTQWIGWSAARVFSPLTFLFALAALCSRPSTRDERRAPSLS